MSKNLVPYRASDAVIDADWREVSTKPKASALVEGFFKFIKVMICLSLLAGADLYASADDWACHGRQSPDTRMLCPNSYLTCAAGPTECNNDLLGHTAMAKISIHEIIWPNFSTPFWVWVGFVFTMAFGTAANLIMFALSWTLLPWWLSPALWLPIGYYYRIKILLPRRKTAARSTPATPMRAINPQNRVGLESPLGEAAISRSWAADRALKGKTLEDVDDLRFED